MGTRSERLIQKERNSSDRADKFYNRQVKDHLTPVMQSFIAKQHMLFIATSDAEGNCDCSPRFGQPGFVIVQDDRTLVYPEFRGNGVFASLGNIVHNPALGLLFVDFLETSVGLHVKGRVERQPPDKGPMPNDELGQRYDASDKTLVEQWVYIHVDEAYIHCSKHVPKLVTRDKDVQWGTDDKRLKSDRFFLD